MTVKDLGPGKGLVGGFVANQPFSTLKGK